MNRRYLYFRLFICVLVSLIPLPSLERRFYDMLVQYQAEKESPDPVSVIDFDRVGILDAHSRLLNQNIKLRDGVLRPSDYPSWDDLVFAELINQLKKAEPALIVVTYPFPSTIDETKTVLTAEAVRNTKIVWASRLLQEGEVEYPPSSLTPYNNYGYANFFPDDDGILRSIELFRSGHVHLALRALREMGQSIHHVNLDEKQLINFNFPIKKLPHLALPQVLFQPVDTWDKWVRGRVVYIGVTSTNLSPLITPRGEFSRAEIHAVVLLNMLTKQGFVREPKLPFAQLIPFNEIIQILISLLMLALTVFITLRTSVTWAGTMVFVQAIALGAVAYFCFNRWNLWIHLASPYFTMLVTYSLLTHFQLINEEELRNKAMQEAENLRKVDELKSNYMSLFSHDLKTPIAKIDAVCDRILKTDAGKELKPHHRAEFNAILDCNHELKTYIHNILQLTRVEGQNVRLNRTPCDLNHVVAEMLQSVTPLAANREISFQKKLEPIFTMELDEKMIREILQNVLENAILYSRPKTEVKVSTREDGKDVVIAVEDSGPGIPEDELPRVTEKFYRGKNFQHLRGSGLGLYLVKYFTELHGGKVVLTSVLGQGTKVEMRFPVEI